MKMVTRHHQTVQSSDGLREALSDNAQGHHGDRGQGLRRQKGHTEAVSRAEYVGLFAQGEDRSRRGRILVERVIETIERAARPARSATARSSFRPRTRWYASAPAKPARTPFEAAPPQNGKRGRMKNCCRAPLCLGLGLLATGPLAPGPGTRRRRPAMAAPAANQRLPDAAAAPSRTRAG